MSLLVVGSVALDSVETPFGVANDVLGGSANFFAAAASLFCNVQMVGVVGSDYPLGALDFLAQRGVDLSGVEQVEGESFRWSGVYSFDLNSRETKETRLGVFADFKPRIRDEFKQAEWVFLGNIHPDLQHDVLDQVSKPRFVAMDTMNFWINVPETRESLIRLLERVDLLMVNDTEARELTGDHNLLRAARWIHERGPSYVVVKKGEHGAILYCRDFIFFAPGYPLEEVFDPTGAGDAFAGGFMGYLARCGEITPDDLRRAMVHGSALGSFAVEKFSVDRLRDLTSGEVHERVRAFRDLTAFDHLAYVPVPVS
ncbi:MAG TPA: PfkB family carbohydrate kinase [Longimicrobiales bacterium]|nr:PfkB family carbohydrate kinase [Longimicrobiales bacterium]